MSAATEDPCTPNNSDAARTRVPAFPACHLPSSRIEQAVRAAGGVMSHAAKMLGIARSTLYARLALEPALREARDEVRDETIDIVESKLIGAALAGEPWAVRFYLSTQARHRGYGPPGGCAPIPRDTLDTIEARIEASPIDLYSLTPDELEVLAQIAEKHQQRTRGDDGRS